MGYPMVSSDTFRTASIDDVEVSLWVMNRRADHWQPWPVFTQYLPRLAVAAGDVRRRLLPAEHAARRLTNTHFIPTIPRAPRFVLSAHRSSVIWERAKRRRDRQAVWQPPVPVKIHTDHWMERVLGASGTPSVPDASRIGIKNRWRSVVQVGRRLLHKWVWSCASCLSRDL